MHIQGRRRPVWTSQGAADNNDYVIMLGGSVGGMTVYHQLSPWIQEAGVTVTVVDERESFLVKPSLPEVADVRKLATACEGPVGEIAFLSDHLYIAQEGHSGEVTHYLLYPRFGIL